MLSALFHLTTEVWSGEIIFIVNNCDNCLAIGNDELTLFYITTNRFSQCIIRCIRISRN